MARTTRGKHSARDEQESHEDPFVNDEEEEGLDKQEGPPTIDPYEVLGLGTEASADHIKKAYRKLALRHHPDKAAPADKQDAHRKFQEIAFAYAVLSDDCRRERYDRTGSTAETLDEDNDFDWYQFYREQFKHVVNDEAISKLSDEYKGSEEEKRDLLKAYKQTKGNLNTMYEFVMLSDVLEDDDRFRRILDAEIAKGNIESLPAYERETDATRKKAKDVERKRREDYDKREASKKEKQAAGGKPDTNMKPKTKQGGVDDMAGLAALIQQRQKSRAGNFFDSLEAKYAPRSRGSKRSTPMEEPTEDMFEANRAKKAKRSTRTQNNNNDKDKDDDIDMGESEEEEAPRKPNAREKAKRRGRARAKA
ncbi:hypothetical protein ACEQ8H_008740 [Pleosporales sp. CAS-2024a]